MERTERARAAHRAKRRRCPRRRLRYKMAGGRAKRMHSAILASFTSQAHSLPGRGHPNLEGPDKDSPRLRSDRGRKEKTRLQRTPGSLLCTVATASCPATRTATEASAMASLREAVSDQAYLRVHEEEAREAAQPGEANGVSARGRRVLVEEALRRRVQVPS